MYSMLPFGHTMDNFFDDFERSLFPANDRHNRLPAFRTDITDEGDHYELQAELPGFNKEDIDIGIKDSVLTISAVHEEEKKEDKKDGRYVCHERRYGTFQRSFNISGIQEDAIAASYDNGILHLNLPKVVEVEDKGRKIDIQ